MGHLTRGLVCHYCCLGHRAVRDIRGLAGLVHFDMIDVAYPSRLLRSGDVLRW